MKPCPPIRCDAHLQREDRHRQHEADPEAPRHVGEFGIGAAIGGHQFGFERHAADRAGARPDLPDLRMHRAGVDRALRHRSAACRACGDRYLSGSAMNFVRQPAEQK